MCVYKRIEKKTRKERLNVPGQGLGGLLEY